jgi:fatty acid desaturase
VGGGLVLWLDQSWPDLAVGVAVAGIALKGGFDILHDAHHETDKHRKHANQ